MPTHFEASDKIQAFLKDWSLKNGFPQMGIINAEPLINELDHLKSWVDQGFAGEMNYYRTHIEDRINPHFAYKDARSAVVFLMPYYKKKPPFSDLKISKYALCNDYHKKINSLLKQGLNELSDHFPGVEGKVFCDSGILLEKALAIKAGLGFRGKNSLLIHPDYGSFVFIAVVLLNVNLQDKITTIQKNCGKCRHCIDACPTSAIQENHQIDIRKCLSYHTIESKKEMVDEYAALSQGYIFGCDLCQDCCPFNRDLPEISDNHVLWHQNIHKVSSEKLQQLTKKDFEEFFVGTPLERRGYQRLLATIHAIQKHQDKN